MEQASSAETTQANEPTGQPEGLQHEDANSSEVSRENTRKRTNSEVAKDEDEQQEPREEKRSKQSEGKQSIPTIVRPFFAGRQDLPRKAVILFMYYGGGYYGLQRNSSGSYAIHKNEVKTNLRTIEDELLEALLKCEAITSTNFETLKTMQFQRAARTDKNVSALFNAVSARLRVDRADAERLNQHLPEQIRVLDVMRTTRSFDAKLSCSHRTYLYLLPTFTLTPVNQFVFLQNTRVEPAQIDKFRAAMRMYIGTHRFHNFTNGKTYGDPSCRRYIMDVTVSDAMERDGLECVQVTVKGQSFMLHQIRKMVGLAVAIARGMCELSVIDAARAPGRFDVPKIPGLGLALEAVHYDVYNRRFGSDGAHPPIDFHAYKLRIERFRDEVLLDRIVRTERTEHVIWEWLKTLTMHTFQPTDSNGRNQPSQVAGNSGNQAPVESTCQTSNDAKIETNVTVASETVSETKLGSSDEPAVLNPDPSGTANADTVPKSLEA